MVKQARYVQQDAWPLRRGSQSVMSAILFPLENLNQLAHAFREVLEGEAR